MVRIPVDASGDVAKVGLVLNGSAMPLALVARYAALPGQVAGSVRLDAQLRGAGNSLHALAASMTGSFAATMTGGSLRNAALTHIAAAALEALRITVPPEGDTAIRCFALAGSVAAGRVVVSTLALDTTYLNVQGTGEADLGAETLSLKLRPLAQVSGSPVEVPVLVDGPFRAIHGRLVASAFEKAGLVLTALFGGDQPRTCAEAGTPAPAPQ